MQDTLVSEILTSDTTFIMPEEPVREPDSLHEEFFEDFLYSFSYDSLFRRRRVSFPLVHIGAADDTTQVSARDWNEDFSFLDKDFYTVFYDSLSQIDLYKSGEQDTVVLERIDLDSLSLTTYHFARRKGAWRMYQERHMYVQRSPLSDFLVFYRQFSTDSIFQQSCIAQPLHFSMADPEDDMEVIEGTIDAEQWFSFCPEVPAGVLSNIIYGQTYLAPQRIVMQKCGQSNGFMEIFTFEKNEGRWRLTSYEN